MKYLKLMIDKVLLKPVPVILIFILSVTFISADTGKKEIRLFLGKEFYTNLSTLAFYQKDSFLDSLYRKSVSARGFLISSGEKAGDKKNFRAVFSDEESDKNGLKIFYYLYFSDRDIQSSMKPGELYLLKGKILGWTLLDTQRKEFIFDMVLEDISIEKK